MRRTDSTKYSLNYVAGTLTVTSAVQVLPASLTFPAQNIGTTSTFQTVTLTNIGGSPMPFSIAISGNFQRGGNGGGTCGTTLNAGRSCTINVRFGPATSGPLTGTLTVNATAAGTGAVALSGTGLGAVATIAPATTAATTTAAAPYNFGGVTRGQVSAPLTINLTNTGSAPLTFNATNGFVLGGNNPTQFRMTTGGSCVNGGTLGAGASCSVTVNFAPRAGTTLTLKSATVTVRSNAPVNPTLRVYVVGTAQ